MKIEIKNVNIKSIILSAFPLLVFAMCLVNHIMEVSGAVNLSLLESILSVVINSLVETMVYLVIFVIASSIYNLFCSFGIKGLTFTIEEPVSKEEIKEETKEETK